jgi:hypothetical protein
MPAPRIASTPRLNAHRGTTAALVATMSAGFLFLRTFIPPGVPVLLTGDQGFFWEYGARMRQGELPYVGFFQMTWPGADLAHLAAFSAFGERVWVVSALLVALGASLAALCFLIAESVVDRRAALLATAVFVVFVFGQSLTTTHHSWSMLFTMAAALAFGVGESRARLATAGALLGLASLCTQTHGVAGLAACGAFIVGAGARDGRERRVTGRSLAILAGAFSITVALGLGRFVAHAGASAFWSSTVAHVAKTTLHPTSLLAGALPERPGWHNVPTLAPFAAIDAIVLFAYGATLWRWWRARRHGITSDAVPDRVVVLWLFGVLLLLPTLAGLTWVRLFGVAWPSVILLAWAAGPALRRRAASVAAGYAVVIAIGALLVRSTERHHDERVSVAGGELAVDRGMQRELSWLGARIAPGGALFAADRPSLYLPLGLHNPLFLDAVIPGGQTTPELAERAARELGTSGLDYVLWADVLDAAAREGDPGIVILQGELRARFDRVRDFESGDQAWKRR